MDIIKLSVPGTLLFRDVVLRVTASTCRLARAMAHPNQEQEASREDQRPAHLGLSWRGGPDRENDLDAEDDRRDQGSRR